MDSHSSKPGRVILSTGIGKLHLMETAAAVASRGFQVDVITGWAPGPGQQKLVKVLGGLLGQKRLYERLAHRRKLNTSGRSRVFQCALSEAASAMVARVSPVRSDWVDTAVWKLFGRESRRFIQSAEVFHVRSGAGGGGAIREARRRGMHIVADHSIAHPAVIQRNLAAHGSSQKEIDEFSPTSRFWRRVMEDCELADTVLVNSDYVRRTLVENGLDQNRVHVAYLGVSQVFFGAKVQHRALKKEPVRVLFVGHFVERKGSHILIDAARHLKNHGIAAEFHIAGTAHQGPVQVEKKGVTSSFVFHGLVGLDALLRLYEHCDVFAFPTLAEGCAKAAMEALAAGIPVITTEACGLPERASGCSELVPLGDSQALAASIQALAVDPARRSCLGGDATALVRSEFTTSDFESAVGHVYQHCCSSRGALAQ